jgi:GR25 family glycosyltransferase involved in LPS biosynthesis
MTKYFDTVFFINLDRREDRLELIQHQLDIMDIRAMRVSAVDGSLLNPDPKIGNGWNHKGVAGCALSHRKVIQMAKEAGYKNFLVIEDDTIFSDEFRNIDFYINQLPDDWDMVYFGGNHMGELKPINVNVARCSHTLTTNCYAMKDTMYDLMLDAIPKEVNLLQMPIDVLYTSIQKSGKYNCYAFKPVLVWQDSIFSDIENKSQELPFLKPDKTKVSLIISSCNQKQRLRFSLISAINQNYYNYEVIVADDGSTDGTHEMIEREFPGVKLSINSHRAAGVYTLAQNWNTAAEMATGERLIFTNADCVFPKTYVAAHADKNMQNDIIFGPNERTDNSITDYLDENITTIELMKKYNKRAKLGRDLRHDISAYTYNTEYNYYYPWGNNMSVPASKFKEAGGFPKLREYGGEEILLSKKLQTKLGLKVKSNVNAINVHLWHPVTNEMSAPFDEFKHDDYING